MEATSSAFAKAPADTKVIPLRSDVLLDRVRQVIDEEGLSQATVAREIGYSSSVISQLLDGKYRGSPDKVAARLVQWLNRRDETQRLNAVIPQVPAWIEAPTARKVYAALARTHATADLGLIYGGKGLSKSTAIAHYRARNTNVWAFEATAWTASMGALLVELAIVMGLGSLGKHPPTLGRSIVERAADSRGLIVIDEAQHLTTQALEALRGIHDKARVGLAVVGNRDIHARLWRGRGNGFAQFNSRIGVRLPLYRHAAGDVHAIARAFGVTGKPEWDALEAIAAREGALRLVKKVLAQAAILAAGQRITRDHITTAAADLVGHSDAPEEAS